MMKFTYHFFNPFLLLPLLAASSPTLLSPRQEGGNCTLETSYPAVQNPKLPDPFTFASGDPVTTLSDFTCRQRELSLMFQQYELGTLPPAPDSIEASISGTTLSITIQVGSASTQLTASLSSVNPSSPSPAMILINGGNLPLPSSGLASITFPADSFAEENGSQSRGKGAFYTLFGADHPAGALTAWAWGVGRLIDGLEQLGEAKTGIDTSRLGVTGCSRNGKGAFVVGALEERIALTVPQESGAGGAACWRVSDDEQDKGKNIQTAGEIVGENVWFGKVFEEWAQDGVTDMPVDHHVLAGLVAPRGLLVLENDIDWLGPVSTTTCMKAGRMVYGAFGDEVGRHMGFSLVGGHGHCQFPSAQQGALDQFLNFFLMGTGEVPPAVEESPASVDMAAWVDWDVPVLS